MNSHSTQPSRAQRHELRKQILAGREALTIADRQLKSSQICNTLLRHDCFVQAQTVFAYINFRSEVITESLVRTCCSLNKRLCVPLTIVDDSRLIPYELANVDQLRPGYCGIPEPDPALHRPVDPAEIDLILLPGSVFDHFGGRLGYGGGFYDRFVVNEAPEAVRIGLAFDLQVVARRLPLLPHDQPLHYLITEQTIYNFTPAKDTLHYEQNSNL